MSNRATDALIKGFLADYAADLLNLTTAYHVGGLDPDQTMIKLGMLGAAMQNTAEAYVEARSSAA